MLALFATGLVAFAGFLVKSNNSEQSIPYLTFGAPVLINAWCAAYYFCSWHKNLLCNNIDYLEELIGKNIKNFNQAFYTFHSDFYGIFMAAKWFTLTLFIILACTVISIHSCCIVLTMNKIDKLGIEGLLYNKPFLWQILYCIFTCGPIVIMLFFQTQFKKSLTKYENL